MLNPRKIDSVTVNVILTGKVRGICLFRAVCVCGHTNASEAQSGGKDGRIHTDYEIKDAEPRRLFPAVPEHF